MIQLKRSHLALAGLAVSVLFVFTSTESYFASCHSVATLIRKLQSRNRRDRSKAAAELGGLRDGAAVPALMIALDDGSLANVASDKARADAACALGWIQDTRAVAALERALRDRSVFVTRWAAWALGNIGDPRAIGALEGALKSADVLTSWEAAASLGQMRDPKTILPLVKALTGELNGTVNETAAVALRNMGSPIFDFIDEALRHRDKHVRLTAIFVLEGSRDLRARRLLSEMANYDVDAEVRERASHAYDLLPLGNQPEQEAYTNYVLAKIMTLKTISGRAGWIRSMGMAPIPGGLDVPALIRFLLKDPSDRIRAESADALGNCRDPRAVPALICSLTLDKESPVRKAAAWALGQIGGPSAIKHLSQLALSEKTSDMGRAAMQALYALQSQRAFKGVVEEGASETRGRTHRGWRPATAD